MREILMKYIVLISLIMLSACNSKPQAKPSHFVCITVFGPAQFDTDNEKVKVGKEYITLEQEENTLNIARSMCVEVIEK